MEVHYPHNMPENRAQIMLIERIARKLGVSTDQLSAHWVDLYSPKFREAWEKWERDIEEIEQIIYARDPLGSNFANMVASILIGKPDELLTNS